MTAVCISSTRGANQFNSANYTIATSAPTSTFDFELRYNLLDQQSKPITKKDLYKFLWVLIMELVKGGKLTPSFFQTAVNGTNFVGPQI
jgi:hypothetical protein